MAHISIGFRRLDNSFKLSSPSMLFYPGILLGRWILPQPPTQRLDVPRTKVAFSLSFSLETQYLHHEGFEGLTIDESTQTLYTMLQSATIQDGGHDSRFTRLFAYGVSNPAVVPPLVGEWVVPLPLSARGKVEACSEIHFVSPGIFLALSRDGDGRGGGDNKSKYKCVFLFFFR